MQTHIDSWLAKAKNIQMRELIGYHDEWVYLVNFLGLKMERFLEPKPGIPPGPQHLADIESYIKSKQVKLIVQSTFNPTNAIDSLAKLSQLRSIRICQNVEELPDCDSYIKFLDFNIKSILASLI